MRRFRWGATNRPFMTRPGAPYGQPNIGAPGPMKKIEPSKEIVPEMFVENCENPVVRTTYVSDFEVRNTSRKVEIDITNDVVS